MGIFSKIGGFLKKVGGWIFDNPWYTLGIIILGLVICFLFCGRTEIDCGCYELYPDNTAALNKCLDDCDFKN